MDALSASLARLPTGKDAQSKRRRIAYFKEVDNNGNGICSLAEIDHACRNKWNIDMAAQAINRAFHAARDMSPPVQDFSDDYIDFSEFRIFLVFLQHYHELHTLFLQLDASGDGRLGVDEFVQAAPLLQSWGVVIEDPVASFRHMDADGGGMVLFDEFAHWALHQGVGTADDERAEALKLLALAKANLASKGLEDMQRAKFSVEEGIQGQGALGKADVGRLLLRGALDACPGMLVVGVHQATGLRIADKTTSDPYAVLSYGDAEQQSKTIKRNLNPIWNETLRFADPGTTLEINIFDYDVQSSDDFLGRVVVDVETLKAGNGHRQRLALVGPGAQGTIDVSFSWQDKRSGARRGYQAK